MNPRLAVAQIQTEAGEFLGSGFFVGPQRILTCKHIVQRYLSEESTTLPRVVWLGESRNVSAIVAHESRDAAYLDLAFKYSIAPQVVPWYRGTISEGKSVNIVGFSKPEVHDLERLTRAIRGYVSKFDLGVIDHPVLNGFSGSPALVNDLVVGMVVATDSDRTFFIPVTALDSVRPPEGTAPVGNCILDVGIIADVPDWGAPAEIKFTVTNSGDNPMKISSVAVKVLERAPLIEPHHFLPGAVVDQYEFEIKLVPEVDAYELLNAPHILKSGETDGFRIQFDADEGWRYRIVIIVSTNTLGATDLNELSIGPIEFSFRIRNSNTLLKAIQDAKANQN